MLCLFCLYRNSETQGSKLLLAWVSYIPDFTVLSNIPGCRLAKEKRIQTAFRISFAKRSIFQTKVL